MCEEHQQEFVFFEWVAQAKAGLAELQARKAALEEQRAAIDEALARAGDEITALEAMLSAHVAAKPEPVPMRVRGIKKALIALAKELPNGQEHEEADIVLRIQERVAGSKEPSIKDAIRSLGREGVFIRSTTDGVAYAASAIGAAPQPALEVVKDPEPHPEEAPTPESLQPGPPPAPNLSLMTTTEVIAALEKELKKRKTFTVAEKNIGWIAADLNVEPKVVRDALKVMVTGDYEFAYEGESKVLRRKAAPGSKEELKRTSIKDSPLFPDAERPQHA